MYQSFVAESLEAKYAIWTGFAVFGFIAGLFLSTVYIHLDKEIAGTSALGREIGFVPKSTKIILGAFVLGVSGLVIVNFFIKLIYIDPELSNILVPIAKSVTVEGVSKKFDLTKYECDVSKLNDTARVVFDVVNSDRYNPDGATIPFCGSRYDRMVFAPNPNESYSDDPRTINGVYDVVAQMTLNAKHEVDFATMMWVANTTTYNPGRVLASAVLDLYQKVKLDPGEYPNGMTVRILTGHMPVMAAFEFGDQSWHV